MACDAKISALLHSCHEFHDKNNDRTQSLGWTNSKLKYVCRRFLPPKDYELCFFVNFPTKKSDFGEFKQFPDVYIERNFISRTSKRT